jgi:hypothetical protein
LKFFVSEKIRLKFWIFKKRKKSIKEEKQKKEKRMRVDRPNTHPGGLRHLVATDQGGV